MIIIRMRRASSVQWAAVNPVLDAGEQGYELDTGVFKVGDGINHWLDLNAYLPEQEMIEAVQVAVAQALVDDSVFAEALEIHVNDPTPHPVYDDAPSLVLLYENAKV